MRSCLGPLVGRCFLEKVEGEVYGGVGGWYVVEWKSDLCRILRVLSNEYNVQRTPSMSFGWNKVDICGLSRLLPRSLEHESRDVAEVPIIT
jgi:hypothetical protein